MRLGPRLAKLVVIAVIATSCSTTSTADRQPATGGDASIFMIPSWIPSDLELYSAEAWSGDDISGGNVAYLTYRAPGASVPGASTHQEGDRLVTISVTDYVAIADAAGQPLDANLDAATIFADLREQLEIVLADSQLSFDQLSFDLLTVRDKPSMVVERTETVGGIIDHVVGVVVIEGNGIMSSVDSHELTRDEAIGMSEGLEPVASGVFDAYATSTTRP
jgi:hypothetical protein